MSFQEIQNRPLQIRTCSVAESSGVIFQYQPQVILATVAVNSIKDPGDAKVYSGVPLLTGIGSDKLFNDVVEYLKSQDS